MKYSVNLNEVAVAEWPIQVLEEFQPRCSHSLQSSNFDFYSILELFSHCFNCYRCNHVLHIDEALEIKNLSITRNYVEGK